MLPLRSSFRSSETSLVVGVVWGVGGFYVPAVCEMSEFLLEKESGALLFFLGLC